MLPLVQSLIFTAPNPPNLPNLVDIGAVGQSQGHSGCSGSRGAGVGRNMARITPGSVRGGCPCEGLAGADRWRRIYPVQNEQWQEKTPSSPE